MKSKIFLSTIFHKRFLPFKHEFKYIVPSLFIDMDELSEINNFSNFFSVNSFNIFSFFEKDHGFRDGRSIQDFIKYYLKKYKIHYSDLRIKIVCFPRIFGYVFNPLSVLYCYDKKNLIAIFYEVKNTSNEQHTYVFSGNSNIEEVNLSHSCYKRFYVSPFIGMKASYNFKNELNNSQVNISINLFNSDNEKLLLATQFGKFTTLTSLGLLKFIIFNPFLCFKVILAILFEAFRIVFKGGKYYAREKKQNDTITLEGKF